MIYPGSGAISENHEGSGFPLLGSAVADLRISVYALGASALPLAVAVYEAGSASMALEVSVVSPLIFTSGQHTLRWAPLVRIGGVDVSSRLTGKLQVGAAEDAARIASFDLIPALASDLDSYEGATVLIDVALSRTGQFASMRLFTGVVEGKTFDPAARVVSLSCRDGYQERIKACASAAEVEQLLGGLAYASPVVLPWSDAEPDAVAYFNGLLATLPGACCIDSSGLWQTVPWAIGTPAESFAASDIFDGSVRYLAPDRIELPKTVSATLTHRYPRLHSCEVDIAWSAPPDVRYVIDGLPFLPKATVQAALDGLEEWLVKGTPAMTSPAGGYHSVIVGGASKLYYVPENDAPTFCNSMSATIYRRWAQTVDVKYSVSIDMGGTSDRDDAINVLVESEFDTSAWEKAASAETTSGLYIVNAPTGGTPPTGYEGLPEPIPPTNGALDHHANISPSDLTAAVNHVVARGLRSATAGKRKRRVSFARPLDPRWAIGAVLGLNAYGVAAVGQVVELAHELDKDTGDIATTITLSCPEGSGTTTSFSASITAPTNTVVHSLVAPTLGTHVGSAFETPATPNEDSLLGFLCNVVSTSDNYDASKPGYQPQFRLIMPEIPALVRDPLQVESPIAATVAIAAGSLAITF